MTSPEMLPRNYRQLPGFDDLVALQYDTLAPLRDLIPGTADSFLAKGLDFSTLAPEVQQGFIKMINAAQQWFEANHVGEDEQGVAFAAIFSALSERLPPGRFNHAARLDLEAALLDVDENLVRNASCTCGHCDQADS